MATRPNARVQGVEYEKVQDEYFQQRQLQRGAAGWVLLVGLGVAYVISGDFAGWNFGLRHGGWGGLLIATLLMALMYTGMVFALAELSALVPTAGGGYGFARRAFGPWGGFLTGTAILIEYAIAPAAIAVFIAAYCRSLFGVSGWPVCLACYLLFVGIHLYGVGEALTILFAITAAAAAALAVYFAAILGYFRPDKLVDIAVTDAGGASPFLPFGYRGIGAAIPYAMWFFLGIEGVPLAAEETRDPSRNLPRGLIGGMLILLGFAALNLVLGPGGAGARALVDTDAPLVTALESPQAFGRATAASRFINLVGLAGLIASFFSLIYAYSRQVFALSRAGYLPRALSLTGRRRTPVLALLVPGTVGFGLSLSGQGDLLILVSAFGATVSYVLMMAAHIALRITEPELPRPYRTPGGVLTSGVALLLGCVALVAGLLVDPRVIIGAAVIYGLHIAYFALYSRHHLVAQAPEEEFAAIRRAEAELGGK